MTEFVITPTNIDYLDSILRNPVTGRWTIPVISFNVKTNPLFGDIDPLNDDPKYQKKIIDNIHTRLTEKWLYKSPSFRKLLKYFNATKKGDEIKVSIIPNINSLNTSEFDKNTRKYVFRYIEKIFITKKLVNKILRSYVAAKHIKWYDLLHNTDTLKDLFAHKLKKLIVATIYELQDQKEEDYKMA